MQIVIIIVYRGSFSVYAAVIDSSSDSSMRNFKLNVITLNHWRCAALAVALIVCCINGEKAPEPETTQAAEAATGQSSLSVAVSFASPAASQASNKPARAQPTKKQIPDEIKTQLKSETAKQAVALAELDRHRPEKMVAKAAQPSEPENQPEKPAETKIVPSIEPEKSKLQELAETPAKPAAEQQQAQAAASNEAGAHERAVISDPVFNQPPEPPRYPKLARRRGQQGIVLLDVWLDEQGRQQKLQIVQSSGVKVLDKSALKAVADWQFRAHTVDGIAIASRIQIPVEFALN